MFLGDTLIAGLKASNPKAQHAFWNSSWNEVYVICAHILGAGPNATDTAVDILTDFMFKHVQKLSNPQSAYAYLRLMSVRRSLRRRDRVAELNGRNHDSLPDINAVCADDEAEKALLLPRLADCLGLLTPRAQKVLKLRFGEDLTNERIGDIVGGSKQYLGRLIRQSLELLRTCLEARIPQAAEIPAPLEG